jgi:hypothetical protein
MNDGEIQETQAFRSSPPLFQGDGAQGWVDGRENSGVESESGTPDGNSQKCGVRQVERYGHIYFVETEDGKYDRQPLIY